MLGGDRRFGRAWRVLLVLGATAAAGCGSAVRPAPVHEARGPSLVLPPGGFDADPELEAALAARRDSTLGNRPSWSGPERRGAEISSLDTVRTVDGRVHESSRVRARTWVVR